MLATLDEPKSVVKHYLNRECLDAAMDADARRDNFQRLITRRFGGSHQAAAAGIGVSAGRVTQLLDPKEPFGERAARRIEEKLRLPAKWLDAVHAPGAQSADEPDDVAAVIADAVAALPHARWVSVRAQLDTLAGRPDMRDDVLVELRALMQPQSGKRRAA